jgi:hypothetical protein
MSNLLKALEYLEGYGITYELGARDDVIYIFIPQYEPATVTVEMLDFRIMSTT